jgi:hypothetical protein
MGYWHKVDKGPEKAREMTIIHFSSILSDSRRFSLGDLSAYVPIVSFGAGSAGGAVRADDN